MHLLCLGKTKYEKMKAKKDIEGLIKSFDFNDENNFKNRTGLTLAKIAEPKTRLFSRAINGPTPAIAGATD